jgi:hypothetical protein
MKVAMLWAGRAEVNHPLDTVTGESRWSPTGVVVRQGVIDVTVVFWKLSVGRYD